MSILNPVCAPSQPWITGQLHVNAKPLRYKWHKWYVSSKLYPNKTYPPYIKVSINTFYLMLFGFL